MSDTKATQIAVSRLILEVKALGASELEAVSRLVCGELEERDFIPRGTTVSGRPVGSAVDAFNPSANFVVGHSCRTLYQACSPSMTSFSHA